jgi:hypothetical protein
MSLKFIQNEIPLWSPFFKGGIFSKEFRPSLEKRGRGDFSTDTRIIG